VRELDQLTGVDYDSSTGVHTVEGHVVAIFKFGTVVVVFIFSQLFLRVACDLTVNVEFLFYVVDVLHSSHLLDHAAQ